MMAGTAQGQVSGYIGIEGRRARRNIVGRVFSVVLLMCTLFGLVMLAALLVDIAIEGAPWLSPSLWQNYPSRHAEKAGMRSGIVGSLIVIGITALASFPLGVGAAIYLEEYAPKNRFTNFILVNISNLAGVPSIVYGMLGLAVFGRLFGLLEPGSAFADFLTSIGFQFQSGGLNYYEAQLFNIPWLSIRLPFGRSILAGGLTMTLLILPVVIIAAQEAIRAVPASVRQAAYGLGATRWQVVSRTVIPIAMPGIMTGMILAISRAIGETAPLIIMGAFTFVAFLPESVWDRFTAMPIQIYNWITLPQDEFRVHLAAAGIIVLLAILLTLNGIAIFLRNRFQIDWQ